MLTRFSVQNFRSYQLEADLLFKPGASAAIFGGNGSGKSNLIRALKIAAGAAPKLVSSPFLLNDASSAQDSGVEIELADGGAEWRYGISLGARGITAESLEEKKENGKWELVFARTEDAAELSALSDRAAEAVLAGLSAKKTVLSILAEAKDQKTRAFRAALSGFAFADCEDGGRPAPMAELLKSPQARAGFSAFMSCLDPTISGCRAMGSKVSLLHRPAGSEFSVPIPLEEESSGTRRMACLYFFLKDVLAKGGVAVIDGLNASLHPLLSREVVRLFKDRKQNPSGAQLVFTSHDAWQLADGTLAKDEIWLAEKDERGASSLTRLSDVKSAKKKDGKKLSAAYMKGKLGGVPEIKSLRVAPKTKDAKIRAGKAKAGKPAAKAEKTPEAAKSRKEKPEMIAVVPGDVYRKAVKAAKPGKAA